MSSGGACFLTRPRSSISPPCPSPTMKRAQAAALADFLVQLWPDELATTAVLGEWFGYVISGRLDLHKILLMVGNRGGEGVIAQTLAHSLVGKTLQGQHCIPSAASSVLSPLIGKRLAVISDARFVGKNAGVVVERLLSIPSGEDFLTVNIKYKEQWTGKLPCRLHVISKRTCPSLGDELTAIVGLIVLLMLSRRGSAARDHRLELELQAELPGILNWAFNRF